MSNFVIDHRQDGTPVFVDQEEHYLMHHGIPGQKWGHRNGPPYPLDEKDYSKREKKAKEKEEILDDLDISLANARYNSQSLKGMQGFEDDWVKNYNKEVFLQKLEEGLMTGISGAALGAAIAFAIPTLNPIITAAIGAVSLPGITIALDDYKYYKGSIKKYEKHQKTIEKSINKIIDKLDREGFDVKYSGNFASYTYPDDEYWDMSSPQKVK